MAIFPAAVAAKLAGRTVRRARLVRPEFKSETMRLWEGGMGNLRTPNGEVWHGAGELGQVGDIESSIGGTAPQVEFKLSGVDPSILSKARSASEEVKGRPLTVLVQHYDDDWQPLDGLFVTFVGAMDTLKISAPAGSQVRVATLMVETLWTQRGFAPFSYISDRDQKRLHPGDRGCEHVASMASKTIKWPQF